MSEDITHPCVSLKSPSPATICARLRVTQQQHLLTATGHHHELCKPSRYVSFCNCFTMPFRRPSTGTQVWMRWREPSRTVKARSSTSSLESGTKRFSAAHRHQPHASGGQVRQCSLLRALWKSLICDPFRSNTWSFACHVDAMPVEHEQYYGFTKFAIELNELEPSLKLLLPPTDTRLRVDQRSENTKRKHLWGFLLFFL